MRTDCNCEILFGTLMMLLLTKQQVGGSKWHKVVVSNTKRDFIVTVVYLNCFLYLNCKPLWHWKSTNLFRHLQFLHILLSRPVGAPTDSQVTPLSRSRRQDLTAAPVPTQSILQNARQYYKRSLTMWGPPSQCRVPINNEGGLKQQSLQDSQWGRPGVVQTSGLGI